MIYNYIVDNFGTDNIFWTFYILNLIFSIVAYKLGFARQLPIGKSVIVYIMLAIGVYIITIFSVVKLPGRDPLPMTETLLIVSLVLGIYRFRLHQDRKKTKTE